MVEKVLVEDGRAVGAIFTQDGEHKTVMARKEVILSCGAIKSPQLLMLSGVGQVNPTINQCELISHAKHPVSDRPSSW